SEVGDAQLMGLEMIRETTEMIMQIKNQLLAAHSRQKSYVDVRHKPLEFEVGDKVMLKVSQWKEMIRETTEMIMQIKNQLLAARSRQKSYVDVRRKPLEFEVGDKVMLKVSQWKDLIIPFDEVRIDEKLHFIKEPVEIIDREEKQLKQSRIPIVKVRWNSWRGPKYTWEREDQMWKKYPHLFDFNKKRATR
nr:putative reverse transcriptase domain-containing protein [Tanacetum cinerariifolium]